ncbi:MAG: cyclic nucleotide-binding domain-containing protein [Gammaproteobacteria bacterium]|nr:MAG: cyclic nucleotide-binding domain-containing protein [Gammaproteobacteria bacterium]
MRDVIRELLDDPRFLRERHWRRHEVPAGTDVFRRGAPGRSLYLIEQGRVRVVGEVELEAGRRIHPGVDELAAGEVFGELVLFGEARRSATVTAVCDARLVEIDGKALLDYCDAHPEVGYRLLRRFMEIAVARLRKTNRKLMHVLAWGLQTHAIAPHL